MNDVFGSSFEMALRIMLLLASENDRALSLDRMIYYDFMVTYGKYFGISEMNLHGDNDYGFGELARRRKYANIAIKDLVLRRMIVVEEHEDGFYYRISDIGRKYADSLKSEYAVLYREYACRVARENASAADDNVRFKIDSSSKTMLRGGNTYD